MQLIGVGYRAAVSGSKLTLNLGYSNPVEFDIPNGLSCKVRPALMMCLLTCRPHWSSSTSKCMADCRCPYRSPRCRPVNVSLHSLLAGTLQVHGLPRTCNSCCACPATLSYAQSVRACRTYMSEHDGLRPMQLCVLSAHQPQLRCRRAARLLIWSLMRRWRS